MGVSVNLEQTTANQRGGGGNESASGCEDVP